MRLYLAGPMRGYDQFNHAAFHEGARLLRAGGHEVFSPAEVDIESGFDITGLSGDEAEVTSAGFSVRGFLAADLAWITSTADGLVMLPGWEKSAGARAEAATAWAIGLPVWEVAWVVVYGGR